MTDVNIAVTAGVGADTIVYSGAANNNYGVFTPLQVLANTIKILIRFDLSGIPSSATCTAATLTLTSTINQPVAVTYNAYKITDANGDWVEGTKNAATAGTGEPCWNNKFYNTTNWAGAAGLATAGTDYIDTVLATVTSALTANTGLAIAFNASGLTVLQSWFEDASNNGLLITVAGTSTYTFHSGEAETVGYHPVLSITYTEASGTLLKVNMNAQMQSLNGGIHG